MFAIFVLCITLQNVVSQVSIIGVSRIVNGTDAPLGKYPAQVSLRYRNSHSCGGSIVSANLVLTAAHCVAEQRADTLTVLAGTIDVYNGDKLGKVHQVIKIIMHEEYSSLYIVNDIALIEVSPSFAFSNLIDSISLPQQYDQTYAGTIGTVIGWGYEKSGGSVMQYLQEANLFIYSDEECYDIHGSNMINPNNVCAGVPGGGKGQCSGDSGGPLIVEGEQVGIVSWSRKPCAIAPYPGVFTQVSSYIKWINSQMQLM